MLVPRFTIRWLLVLMAVVGALSLVGGSAVRELSQQASKGSVPRGVFGPGDPRFADGGYGRMWTVGASAAVVSLGLVFVLYALVFMAASPLIVVKELALGDRAPANPFATAQPPPQIFPPPEPE
jgi:hypothetical protein